MKLQRKETVADGASINVKHAACPTTSFRREGKKVFIESIDVE